MKTPVVGTAGLTDTITINGEAVPPWPTSTALGQNVDLPDFLPPLRRDTSFWGMAATQFLGAFNDNLFKQLILLLATPTAAELAAKSVGDRQARR